MLLMWSCFLTFLAMVFAPIIVLPDSSFFLVPIGSRLLICNIMQVLLVEVDIYLVGNIIQVLLVDGSSNVLASGPDCYRLANNKHGQTIEAES